MTAQLGQTGDPTQLVPGDVGAIADTLWAMRSYGDTLHEAGAGLNRIDTTGGWSGPAADQFRSAFHGRPGKWLEAGDAFHDAANALDGYATALRDAQHQAGDAIRMWNDGEQATRTAVAGYNRQVDQANQHNAAGDGPPIEVPPFQDPGQAQRQAAQRLLDQARGTLKAAGDTATQAVKTATGKAPHKPGFWSKVGHFFSTAGHDIESVGAHTLNGLASFGNAMINHPGDTAALLGGTVLAGVGAAGDGVGTVLAATGVGAPIGIPLDAVSTAAVITGGTMMAASAGDLTRHAATDDHVSPADAGGGDPPSEGTSGTKTDRIKEHLTDRDLDAARRELNGETVATKPDGTPWDHVDEVRNAQRGLVNRINQLQRILGDSRISDAERVAAQSELSEASRLLDYSEGFVPRP